MLYVNNKFLDLNNPAPEFAEIASDFHTKTAALRDKFGKSVTLLSRKQPKLNATGIIEPVANATIPLHIAISGKHGREEWLYCEVAPEIKDGIVNVQENQKIVRYGELAIDLETDPDLAYFLLEKHSMIKKGRYVVVDFESDEKKKADRRSKEVRLSNAIYGENTQLNLDLGYLRMVSKRWGIGNADSLSKSALQNALYDNVLASDSKKGARTMEDFLRDIKSEDNTEQLRIGSTVRDAIDEGILVFDNINKEWQINYKDGTFKALLSVSVDDLPRKDEVLIVYLQGDNHSYAKLVAAMGGDDAVKAIIDEEAVRNTEDLTSLRVYAKSLGINSFGRKKEELRLDILSKLQR